uniref:Response regulator receiver modulated metal dependent phosphohydrolase n=1 Tax=uncultured bacterium contig00001 TaxID=1181493 RepID=A0A806K176_9BACT|nr:hypothetical protein [uncultured bacterium contig00001]
MKNRIMLVDDNTTSLAATKANLQDHYDVLTVNSGERALQLLEKVQPDLILLDVLMPDMDGYETIKQIKANENAAISQIPVIFLTGQEDADSEFDGLSLGAVDYIAKSTAIPLMLKRIEVHLLLEYQKHRLEEQNHKLNDFNENLRKMVEEKTASIQQLQDVFITTFSELVESRDESTGGHIVRTQIFLKTLVEGMMKKNIYPGLIEEKDVKLLVKSSQLHDIGKISIPDAILNKKGRLTDEEFEIMKQHATIGKDHIAKIMDKVDEKRFIEQASIFAYSHHERWDGKGYPLGLAGEDIPIQGRLMAIADVYDALISERPYKPAFSHEKAAEIIIAGSGTQFDPILVGLFMDVSAEFRDAVRPKDD